MLKGCTMRIDTFYTSARALDTTTQRHDTTICFSRPILLSVTTGKDYQWDNGDTGRTRTISTGGVYWARYFTEGCTYLTDTFVVTAATAFDTTYRITDTIACLAAPIALSVSGGYEHSRWDDGSTAGSRFIFSAGTYWSVSYRNCAVHIDSFYIKAKANDTLLVQTDTMVCLMQPVVLSAPGGYKAYQWHNGKTGTTLNADTPGRYWLVSTNDCSIRIDTFVLRAKAIDTAFFSTDTVVCFANSLTAQAPGGFTSYLWSDNSTGPYNTLNGNTRKWVVACNQDCFVRVDTFRASFVDFKPALPEKDSICGEAVLTLDATIADPNAGYRWQDGSSNPVYKVSKEGTYTVSVTVGPCLAQRSTQVIKKEFSVSLGDDRKVCTGTPVQLVPDKGISFTWQDGSSKPGFEVRESGTYSVQAVQGNCIASDTVRIDIVRCNRCISIPNAFTPNADGRNDVFRPVLECPTLRYTLKIYNRYGQEIFTTTNPAEAWNGTFRDKEQELGVYYYLIRVWFDYPGATEELLKGDISLLR